MISDARKDGRLFAAVYVFNLQRKALTLEPVHLRIYEVLP